MICSKCGKEIFDDSLFCEYCGNKIDITEQSTNSTKEEKSTNSTKEEKSTSDTKEKQDTSVKKADNTGKSNGAGKRPLIIVAAVVAVVICIAAVLNFMPRSPEKAVSKLAKAVSSDNEKKIAKVLLPSGKTDEMQSWLDSNSMSIRGFVGDLDVLAGDFDVSVEVGQFPDGKYKEAFDSFLSSAGIDMSYDELSRVTVKAAGTKKTASMLGYSIGSKWYLFPGVLEYIGRDWKEKDVENAGKIADAVKNAIDSDSFIYAAMLSFSNTAINLNTDINYLPEIFADALAAGLGEVPALNCIENGESGFSFTWNEENDSVTVYISSDTDMCEWCVYPDTDDAYYSGSKQDSGVEQSPKYSYAKLTSSDSGMLGYWQGDNAAMYVGYDVTGGGERFTIYLADEYRIRILHNLDRYSVHSIANGIAYEKDLENEREQTNITMQDDNTVSVHVDASYWDSDVKTDYTMKKAGFDKSILDQFAGKWVNYDYGSYLEMEFEVHDACKILHQVGYCPNDKDYPGTCITLYDGKMLIYLWPDTGLIFEPEGRIGFYCDSYEMTDDYMIYNTERIGGGGGSSYTCYREDSDTGQVFKAMDAYQKYIDDKEWGTDLKYTLYYLDDDIIPECILMGIGQAFILSYQNGQVVSVDYLIDIHAKEGTSEIVVNQHGIDTVEALTFYELKDGDFSVKGYADISWGLEDDEVKEEYSVEGEKTSEKKYNEYVDGFGEYNVSFVDGSDYLYSAYLALISPEE